jgi:phage terminase large subunit
MSLTPSQIRALSEDVGAIVARHDRAQRATDFTRYADDPVGFQRDVLKFEPWSRQVEIAEAVRDCPAVVVRSCNGMGKDAEAARLALWWVYARGGLALVTGPTERQVRQVVMGEVARAWSKAQDLPGELYEMALRLGRDSHAGILAFTAGDVNKVAGLHAPRLLVIVTEAQGVESWVWEGIFGCATGEDSKLLALGNPLVASGKFYDLCQSPHWHSLKIPASEHPNVVEGREVIPGAVTRQFVTRISAEYGVGSSVYQSRVLAEFPDEADDALVSRSAVLAAFARHDSRELEHMTVDEAWVVGVDPARFGEDSTVLAAMQGPVVRELVEWSRKDLMETTGRVVEECRRLGLRMRDGGISPAMAAELFDLPVRPEPKTRDHVIIDEAGLGAGLFDRLRELKLTIRVTGFNGGRGPTPIRRDAERFLNLRAQSYFAVRELLEEGKVALPRHDRLLDELVSTRWKVSSAGKIQLENKDDLRGRLGRSPDAADACAMVLWEYWRTITGRRLYVGGALVTF